MIFWRERFEQNGNPTHQWTVWPRNTFLGARDMVSADHLSNGWSNDLPLNWCIICGGQP